MEEFPVNRAKARRTEKRTVLVIRDGERVAIRKRPKKGLLAGLYEFPNWSGHLSREESLARVEKSGTGSLFALLLWESQNIFFLTRGMADGIGYLIQVASLEAEQEKDQMFVEIKTAKKNTRFRQLSGRMPGNCSCVWDRISIRMNIRRKDYETADDYGAVL